MSNHRTHVIVCVLALAGCGSAEPIADGVYNGTCVSSGVQITLDGTETPYMITQSGVVEIRRGLLIRGDCAIPIIGYDGRAFDLTATGCEEPETTSFFDGGSGTLGNGVLRFEVDATTDRLEDGTRFEYHAACEAFEVP